METDAIVNAANASLQLGGGARAGESVNCSSTRIPFIFLFSAAISSMISTDS
jgi:hypothetical protein